MHRVCCGFAWIVAEHRVEASAKVDQDDKVAVIGSFTLQLQSISTEPRVCEYEKSNLRKERC